MKSQSSLVNEINLRPSEIAFYRENGYLTIPGFIPAELVQNLREEVLDMLAENGISRDLLSNASTAADKLRACSNYYKSSWLDKMINSENTLKLASSLIGGKACRYYPFSAVKAGGGGGQFHMHQDNNYTKHEPAEGSINIWVALVDMTPEISQRPPRPPQLRAQ